MLLLAGWQVFVELHKTPTARGGVFFGVLDHELDSVHRWAGHEGLFPAKGVIIFLRRD
jgi:hypothetical protein